MVISSEYRNNSKRTNEKKSETAGSRPLSSVLDNETPGNQSKQKHLEYQMGL